MPDDSKGAAADAMQRRQTTRLVIILVLIALFFGVELVGAKLAKSDVLEADAYHLLMDVFALAISLAAMRLASRRPSARYTFGLRRAESLAAAANGVLVIGVVIELLRDAIEHLSNPTVPKAGLMLVVATGALVVNGLNAWLLHGAMGHHGHSHGPGHAHDHGHAHHDHAHHDHGHDAHAHAHDHEEHPLDDHGHGQQLNLRGAWLHLVGDALGSLAAFLAGLAMRFGAPPIVDPIASFVVVAILVVGAVRLLRDAGHVLLEAAPLRLPVAKVEKALLAYPGVKEVHALHVWTLGTGHDAITAHVRAPGADAGLATKMSDGLRDRFAVEYVTIQVEATSPSPIPTTGRD